MISIKLKMRRKLCSAPNYVLLQVSDNVDPDLLKTLKVLDDWVDYPIKITRVSVISVRWKIRIWSSFYFWHTFENSRYKVNCIPNGCVPLPKN